MATALHPRGGAPGGRGLPARVEAVQAFEAALAPQAGGVIVGISHEGGTRATNAALLAARDAGALTALVTHAPTARPAGLFADVVVATDEGRPELVPHGRLPVADPGRPRPSPAT